MKIYYLLIIMFISSCGESNSNEPTQCSVVDLNSCGEDKFCFFEDGQCNGDGTCKDKPEVCTEIYAPVCGCDGITYSNPCFSYGSGMSIRKVGEC